MLWFHQHLFKLPLQMANVTNYDWNIFISCYILLLELSF